MRKLIILLLLFVMAILASCANNSATSPHIDPRKPDVTVVVSTRSKPSSSSTNSLLSSHPTESTTLIPLEPTPDVSIDETFFSIQCLELSSQQSTSTTSTGIIILEDFVNVSPIGGLYQWDAETGTIKSLAEDVSGFYPSVSPNQERLAYRVVDKTLPSEAKLVILRSDGEVEQALAWQADWGGIVAWFDNDQIWIEGTEGYPRPLILLNPFTNRQQIFKADFPNIYLAHPPYIAWGPFGTVEAVYDPSLSLVIYPELRGEDGFITLWDLKKEKAVAKIDPGNFYGHQPEWSRNGGQFILNMDTTSQSHSGDVAYEELFSIDRAGQTQQLTNLMDFFKEVKISEFAWSPDERYIAFLVFVDPYEYPDIYPDVDHWNYPRLSVYDSKTATVTNYCLPAESTWPLYWSPDSRQLVLGYGYGDQPNNKTRVYLVDILEKYAVRIAEDMQPVGWMKSPIP